MRRPWIKVETATPDKPEICAIATTLRMDADAVLGKLVRLWSWVEVNRVKPDDLGVTKEFLDKLVGRKGFAAAMAGTGWLLEEDGKLGFRNLHRHNGGAAKVRALTAQRVALHRKRKLANTPPSVTEALRVRVSMGAESPLQEVNNGLVENIKTEPEKLVASQNEESSSLSASDVIAETSFDQASVSLPADEPLSGPVADASGLHEPEEGPQGTTSRKRRSKSDGGSSEQQLLF
jgi:hypothetical protein